MEYAELEGAHQDQSPSLGPVQDILRITLCAWQHYLCEQQGPYMMRSC